MRRRSRDVEQSSLSFLDAICCGFGALIILVVITKSAPPSVDAPTPVVNAAQAQQLALLAQQTAAEREAVEAELAAAEAEKAAAMDALSSLRTSADSEAQKVVETERDTVVTTTLERQLASARQTLTEEMRRLQGSGVSRPDAPVAGIPIDSEYVIFVIDTSGSMQQMAWRSVQQKMTEALDAYPQIKGFQVMSDMGEYMFSSYRGQWIPDTPARRRTVLQRLANWAPFSNSSPVEGITTAIRTYARADRKISIYVFGDDFTGRSANEVVQTVRRINPKGRNGQPTVRIHGIGFPVLMNNQGAAQGALRFANLMRVLAEESGGAFIGLEETR